MDGNQIRGIKTSGKTGDFSSVRQIRDIQSCIPGINPTPDIYNVVNAILVNVKKYLDPKYLHPNSLKFFKIIFRNQKLLVFSLSSVQQKQAFQSQTLDLSLLQVQFQTPTGTGLMSKLGRLFTLQLEKYPVRVPNDTNKKI